MIEYPFAMPALVGAALQELLHWYNLRQHLSEAKNERILQSAPYWACTTLVLLLTPVAVHYWYDNEPSVTSRTLLLSGAAMPVLLKKGIRALLGSIPEDKLGPNGEPEDGGTRFLARDYFEG